MSRAVKVDIRLRKILQQRNMTQKELCFMTGIRPAAISHLCRGYVERLNLEHISRIAEALRITDIGELICLVPSK
jgi:transcriptional regulator with XRE-family HTH domain